MEFFITQERTIIRSTYVEAESFEQACEIFSKDAHEYPEDAVTVQYFATDEDGGEYEDIANTKSRIAQIGSR